MESSDIPIVPSQSQATVYSQPHNRLKPLYVAAIVVGVIGLIFAGIQLTHTEAANLDSAASAPAAEITITSGGFLPASLDVKKGQSVTWVNHNSQPHVLTITPKTAAVVDAVVERVGQGDSYSYVFDKSGAFQYYDATSPQRFQGVITVK